MMEACKNGSCLLVFPPFYHSIIPLFHHSIIPFPLHFGKAGRKYIIQQQADLIFE
jgi:hypothetical protein